MRYRSRDRDSIDNNRVAAVKGSMQILKRWWSMDIDLIFRIAGVGIIVAVLDILLKKSGKDEQAMMTTIAGLVVVLMMLVGEIGTLFETIRDVFGL